MAKILHLDRVRLRFFGDLELPLDRTPSILPPLLSTFKDGDDVHRSGSSPAITLSKALPLAALESAPKPGMPPLLDCPELVAETKSMLSP